MYLYIEICILKIYILYAYIKKKYSQYIYIYVN
jgi:hypothetical protein